MYGTLNDYNLMSEFVQICFENYKLIVLQELSSYIKIGIRYKCKDIYLLAQIIFRGKEQMSRVRHSRIYAPVHCKVCEEEVIRQSDSTNFYNFQYQNIPNIGMLICRDCFNRPDLNPYQLLKYSQSLLRKETLRQVSIFATFIVDMQASSLNEYAKESVERIDTAIKKKIIELIYQELPIITEIVKTELENTNAIIQYSLKTLDTFKNELTSSRIQSLSVENVAVRGRWDSERNAKELVFSNQLTAQMISLMEQDIQTKREKSTALRCLLEDGKRITNVIRPLIEPDSHATQSQVVKLRQPEREEVVAVENRIE